MYLCTSMYVCSLFPISYVVYIYMYSVHILWKGLFVNCILYECIYLFDCIYMFMYVLHCLFEELNFQFHNLIFIFL